MTKRSGTRPRPVSDELSRTLSVEKAIREAERHLASADAIMKRLIARHGRCPLAEREFQPFHMLANSIISQQLSTQAAAAIKRRLCEIVSSPFHPEPFLAVSVHALRGAGLSRAKARYIRELAARVDDRRLAFDELVSKDDEAVIATLVEIPGVGRWTAQMFLIFGLKRLDVLAIGDAGLQRAARVLYGKERNSKTLLSRAAKAWRPYRSVASWYLWRSLETESKPRGLSQSPKIKGPLVADGMMK